MTWIVPLLIAITYLIPRCVHAEPRGPATYDFDILSVKPEDALRDLSRITGLSVSYIPDRLENPHAPAIRGRFTADQALKLILEPAAIDYEWVDERTVYVGLLATKTLQRFEAGTTTYDGMSDPHVVLSSRLYPLQLDRVAVSDAIRAFPYYFGIRVLFAPAAERLRDAAVGHVSGSYSIAQILDHMFSTDVLNYEWVDHHTILVTRRARSEVPDVLVEAARISAPPLAQAPTRVLDRAQIDRLGVSSLSQLMRHLAQQPFWRAEGFRTDGAQGVQLRGLGSDTTLVLINGHRVGTTASLYDSNSFDLNTIPIVAVERVEIYLDSIPFSVGADAIGGMVNVVLKSGATDPRLDLHYGSADAGGRERRVTFTGGVTLDALRAVAVLDYFERARLLGSERDRWRDQDYRRFGGTDFRSADTNPGNVSSLTTDNLPGLPSRFAAVPPHAPGERLSSADFLATAGQRNLDSLMAYRSIVPEAERMSAMVAADLKVSASWHAFGEFFYTKRENVFNDLPASLSNAVVPAENPFNPFGVPVRTSFLFDAIERERISQGDFARALLGIEGEFSRSKWEFTLLQVDDRARLTTRGDLDARRVAEALSQRDPDRALNVFDDGLGGPRSLLDSLIAPPVEQRYSSTTTEATAQIQRDLFTWTQGTATALAGTQWAELDINVAGVPLDRARRSVASAFVEVDIPMMAGQASTPVLAAGLQGRIDHLSDFRKITNSLFALDWQPSRDMGLRATYGTSYRAPSLFELYQPVISATAPLADPKRGGEVNGVAVTFGGNPNLSVATADSWSLGLKWMAQWRVPLNFDLTYWQSRIKDRISVVDTRVVLDREELFQERLVRAAPTAADIVDGRPGRILSLDMTPEGGGTLRASGMDLRASAHVDTRYGTITPELSATWMREYQVIEWPGLPPLERVARASTLGTIPRWRGMAGLSWGFHGLAISTQARLVSGYADVSFLQNRLTGRDVESQALIDLQASLHLDHEPGRGSNVWHGVTVTAGIENLFDQGPPFAEVGALFGFDPSQGDLRERFGYLRLTKEF
jgi:iron complex outermembrane receptor protein